MSRPSLTCCCRLLVPQPRTQDYRGPATNQATSSSTHHTAAVAAAARSDLLHVEARDGVRAVRVLTQPCIEFAGAK